MNKTTLCCHLFRCAAHFFVARHLTKKIKHWLCIVLYIAITATSSVADEVTHHAPHSSRASYYASALVGVLLISGATATTFHKRYAPPKTHTQTMDSIEGSALQLSVPPVYMTPMLYDNGHYTGACSITCKNASCKPTLSITNIHTGDVLDTVRVNECCGSNQCRDTKCRYKSRLCTPFSETHCLDTIASSYLDIITSTLIDRNQVDLGIKVFLDPIKFQPQDWIIDCSFDDMHARADLIPQLPSSKLSLPFIASGKLVAPIFYDVVCTNHHKAVCAPQKAASFFPGFRYWACVLQPNIAAFVYYIPNIFTHPVNVNGTDNPYDRQFNNVFLADISAGVRFCIDSSKDHQQKHDPASDEALLFAHKNADSKPANVTK